MSLMFSIIIFYITIPSFLLNNHSIFLSLVSCLLLICIFVHIFFLHVSILHYMCTVFFVSIFFPCFFVLVLILLSFFRPLSFTGASFLHRYTFISYFHVSFDFVLIFCFMPNYFSFFVHVSSTNLPCFHNNSTSLKSYAWLFEPDSLAWIKIN